MSTTVIYNDVKLHNVVTREWEQEIAYDESRTDALYHKFRMRFEGILHAEASGPAWVGISSQANIQVQYADVHSRILQPRHGLIVLVSNAHAEDDPLVLFQCWPSVPPSNNGTTMDDGNLGDPDRDVNNGPKPTGFRILQVIGAKCFRVAFSVECAKVVCSATSFTVPLILNNRWSVSEEMDENNFTTRTIAGRVRLSCGVTADQLLTANPTMPQVFAKYYVVPGLEEGFRRERIEFSADKSGLECEYRVTDRQVHTAAPWPATKMNARHTQTTSDGFTVVSEVHVQLEGPPHADKKLLISRAIQVIDAKLNFVNRRVHQSWVPEAISIPDHFGDANVVEAFARIHETAGQDTENAEQSAMLLANLRMNMGEKLELPSLAGEPHEYDPGISDPPAPFGYVPHKGERRPTVLLTLQCYLQQPCQALHGIYSGAPSNDDADEEESRNRYTPFVIEGTGLTGYIPESSGDSWSESHKQSVYTFARLSTRYVTNHCRVQLPIAANDAGSGDTCQVFRIGLSQGRREIEYDAERVGQWPQLPSPEDYYEDGNLKGRLLRHWVEPHPPCLAADGVSYVYRVTAHYLYALNRPPSLSESVHVGVAPQTKLTKDSAEAKFNPQNAYNGDLGP